MMDQIIEKTVMYGNTFIFWYIIVYLTILLIDSALGSFIIDDYNSIEEVYDSDDLKDGLPVSVIVPVYNENITAVQTVRNLCEQEYGNFEIVIVDDGSKDDTKDLLIKEFGLISDNRKPVRYQVPCRKINEIYKGRSKDIRIILVSKENGGCKADASNAGINICSYPYFINMDGDEILQKDALRYISKAVLYDDRIKAVGGNLRISNNVVFRKSMPHEIRYGKNMITDMQVLEYGRAFIGSRVSRNVFGSNLIISGGFGLFHKQSVIDVGGYDTSSMGEDMELTIKLEKYFRDTGKDFRTGYEPRAVCWTQAPETLHDLKRQRERWHCGLIQNLIKYRGMILNPKYGTVGLFAIPFTIMYELLNGLFILIGLILVFLAASVGQFNLIRAVEILGIYILCGIVLTLNAYSSQKSRDPIDKGKWGMLYFFLVSAADSLFLRPFIFFCQISALFRFSRIRDKWESPARVSVTESQ